MVNKKERNFKKNCAKKNADFFGKQCVFFLFPTGKGGRCPIECTMCSGMFACGGWTSEITDKCAVRRTSLPIFSDIRSREGGRERDREIGQGEVSDDVRTDRRTF